MGEILKRFGITLVTIVIGIITLGYADPVMTRDHFLLFLQSFRK